MSSVVHTQRKFELAKDPGSLLRELGLFSQKYFADDPCGFLDASIRV